MCGRYALHSLVDDLRRHFGLFDELEFQPRFNVTPSLYVPVVRQQDDQRQLALCQWGLVPGWSKAMPKTRPINARAETVAEKLFFRSAFRRRRCLVPANGYYEWQKTATRKQPWYIHPAGADLFALAGVWDRWEGPAAVLDSFAIITTYANEATRTIHDRMPVILDPGDYGNWLEKGSKELLVPYSEKIEAVPVSTRVNSPKNDGRELIAPVKT